ncbi:MAG: zinc-ribbon domain-containing protein [Candidatus Bathyarchaeota archaeon]|nr:zinc-ribbon domain-containing protein [Candidatus Bathyarchaeota archaeon]
MTYCFSCGKELPKDALYCSNCGSKVVTDTSAVGAPSEELKEALTKMSVEMEKAFNIAAKQVQVAFKTARENMQKAGYKEPVVCSNCGEKNAASAVYCFQCGKSLSEAQPAAKPDEST